MSRISAPTSSSMVLHGTGQGAGTIHGLRVPLMRDTGTCIINNPAISYIIILPI